MNGRGLELRFRTPSGWETTEPDWRRLASARFSRGTVTCALTLDEERVAKAFRLDEAALGAAIEAARLAEDKLRAAGVSFRPLSIEGLLNVRGVFEPDPDARGGGVDCDAKAQLGREIGAGFERALEGLAAARVEEGGRLFRLLSERFEEIARLTREAKAAADERAKAAATQLAAKVQALMGAGAQVEESRLAQELALIAVRADVAEEVDRLNAHVEAGLKLLSTSPPVGRKLEFLMQELHREANTLCAKSQDQTLTEIGLALKVAIDQMREQSANVE